MAANKKAYNKLVRDKMPEIIRASGEKPITRTLQNKEYLRGLIEKLKEEVLTFEKSHKLEDLAEIKELTIAIREAMGIHAGELEDARRAKANKHGRFKKRILLESVK